jgi:hypothetical protein
MEEFVAVHAGVDGRITRSGIQFSMRSSASSAVSTWQYPSFLAEIEGNEFAVALTSSIINTSLSSHPCSGKKYRTRTFLQRDIFIA